MVRFSKYSAAGNDFIVVRESDLGDFVLNSDNVRKLCDRHNGIGADGILLHSKPESEKADAKMTIFNSDGTIAEMCGNGIRCFAAHMVNDCGFSENPLSIETGNGVLPVKWEKSCGHFNVSANLGKAVFLNETETVSFQGMSFTRLGVSMGNPHVVYICRQLSDEEKKSLLAENDMREWAENLAVSLWKLRELGYETNVEVVITDAGKCEPFTAVCERGVGITLACGTGGAAVVNTLLRIGRIEKNQLISVNFRGGIVNYFINDSGETVISGEPLKIFKGEF